MRGQPTTVVVIRPIAFYAHIWGQECVGPASTVRLRQSVESTFTYLFVRTDVFEHRNGSV
jgi:hypothetical protein